MLAFEAQGLGRWNRHSLTGFLLGNWDSVHPIDPMRVEDQLSLSLQVIKNCHLSVSNNREFLLLKGMQPTYKNMCLYSGFKIARRKSRVNYRRI
jgi:hypothetical protein